VFDFSFFLNIDFAKKENLIFLAIVLVLLVVLIWAISFLVYEILRLIRKIFARFFGTDERRPNLQSDLSKEQNVSDRAVDPFVKKMESIVPMANLKAPISGQIEGKAISSSKPEKEIPIPSIKQYSQSEENKINPTESKIDIPISKTSDRGSQEGSIFGGNSELSRLELKEKLRSDASVWKAGVSSRFNLSREERAKLEKELFSDFGTYGRNISRKDFETKIKLMNKEKVNAGGRGDFAKQEKLRKEVNFLKKIGGIK